MTARRSRRVLALLLAVGAGAGAQAPAPKAPPGAPPGASEAARETALKPVGQCREGLPQGTYGLRSAGGRTRAIGAFNHGRRTGSFIFWNEAGERVAHVPYDDDAINGTLALWYPGGGRDRAGVQKLEAAFAAGRRHGTTRSWHPDGRPRTEIDYRDGTLVDARAWDANGAPLADAQAKALAQRDLDADTKAIGALESLVADHRPVCEPAPGPGTRV